MDRRLKRLILILATLTISTFIIGCSSNEISEESLDDDVMDEGDYEENTSTGLPDFNLKDLEGNMVSSEIFKDYNMTIANIWQST